MSVKVIRDPNTVIPGASVANATSVSPGAVPNWPPILSQMTDVQTGLSAKASIAQSLVLNPGPTITDANATVQPVTDVAGSYTAPAATFSTNRTTHLGIVGPPPAGYCLVLKRSDLSANTWTIVNDGTNGGNVWVFAGNPALPQSISVYFDGVDWLLNGFINLGA
jgi:hypothetical protein